MFTTLRVLEPFHPCDGRCSAHGISKGQCYLWPQGAVSIRKTVLPGMVISMLKIRRPLGRLIFNMGIAPCCLIPSHYITMRDKWYVTIQPTLLPNGWYMDDGVYMPVCCLTLPAPRAVIEQMLLQTWMQWNVQLYQEWTSMHTFMQTFLRRLWQRSQSVGSDDLDF